jgi:hypothetical protein
MITYEYQINEHLSFKGFVGLSTSDKAPDAKHCSFIKNISNGKNYMTKYLIGFMVK